ncbi:CHASE domain-containing protein [Novispirillum sp. DQ9]|uniref:CHASE domain-containing protein n=1 Tax=Novispirillum sp. DQ9 TaxID=3398612 RepID=UPI003C7B5681
MRRLHRLGRVIAAGRPVVSPFLVLLVSLLFTGLMWWAVRVQANHLAEVRFTSVVNDVVSAIDKRMRDYEQILRSGVAYMAAENAAVTREEWRDFVAGLRVEENYPGIQGIGYSVRVTPRPVGAFEAEMRAQGAPGFTVHPGDPRDDIHAIVYLEPQDHRNQQAIGYDMYSDPIRRAAMARARDTGRAALSDKVTLVQEITDDIQAGALLYEPLYRPGSDPRTVEERREALLGFVYSPFRMDDLMRGIVGPWLDEVVVSLHDGTRGAEARLFGPPEMPDNGFLRSTTLEVFGRRWEIDVAATRVKRERLFSPYPDVVLGAGLVISVLLWWLSRAILAERRRRLALTRANRQLAQARADAEAAGASKSKFLAAASHDIRQPVQSLVLLVAALSRKLADHPAHSYVRQLETSLDALRLLLDALLDISRLDAGVVEPHIGAVDVHEILGRLRRDYAPRAAAAGLRLRVVDCGCWVRSDQALLERILRNLLENALRYTPSGKVLVGCRRRGETMLFEVHDTGIGIAAADRAAIFEEFYQIDNPERDRHKGLGLGLAIVRRLAVLLDHDLKVVSEVGVGSCFSLRVPRAPAPVPCGQESPDEGRFAALARPLTVLVVDDEEMVRDALRVMLEDWGCTVRTAADAAGALDAYTASGGRLDVVVTDYRLRDNRTGVQLMDRLNLHAGRQVPAILLTGDTAPERIAEAAGAGHVILHKPVGPRDLRSALEHLAPTEG